MFSSDVMLLADGTPTFRPKLDADQRGFDPAYRLFETDNGWLQVAAIGDGQWAALCTATGVPDPDDRADAEARLEAAFRTKTAVMWSHTLDDAGVPNEVALDVDGGESALYDADAERLGLVTEYEHPTLGLLRQFGETIHFSDTPGQIVGPPPRSGRTARSSRSSECPRPRWTTSRPAASSPGPATTIPGAGNEGHYSVDRHIHTRVPTAGAKWGAP